MVGKRDRTGACLCGAVTFTARGVTEGFHACHCKMCQRTNGGVSLSVTVPAKDIDWTGLDHVRRIRSSEWAERAWCDTCGSGLWYRLTVPGPDAHDYDIQIGLFDDANGFVLTKEIFVDRKVDSFDLAGKHEMLTEAEFLASIGAEEGS